MQPIGATLYYVTSDNLNGEKTRWIKINQYTEKDGIIRINYPNDAAYGYVSTVDIDGNVISTEYMNLNNVC